MPPGYPPTPGWTFIQCDPNSWLATGAPFRPVSVLVFQNTSDLQRTPLSSQLTTTKAKLTEAQMAGFDSSGGAAGLRGVLALYCEVNLILLGRDRTWDSTRCLNSGNTGPPAASRHWDVEYFMALSYFLIFMNVTACHHCCNCVFRQLFCVLKMYLMGF